MVGLASSGAARAADTAGVDVKALSHETQRLSDASGQFYLAWWVPQSLAAVIMRNTLNVPQADGEQMLRALEPYLVLALSRGQVGANGLEDVHDKADLLQHSVVTVNGKTMTASPADQNDPGAQPALAIIRSALAAMLGSNGRAIEFALYRWMPDVQPLDPAMSGTLDCVLYRKHYRWQLPVWAPSAPVPMRASAAPLPAAPPNVAPVAPAAPVASAPVAPIAAAAAAAAAAAPAVVPSRSPSATPLPVQRRKIDPTTGEEFPERYDYNPYTGQKLVSQ